MRYFTSESRQVWIKVLQDVVHAYNHSVHRSIKRKPADVTAEIVGEIRDEMNKRKKPPNGKDDIQVGETVRISKVKSVLGKRYLRSWTE